VRRRHRVAEAMESRCFGASRSRTWLFDLRLRGADYAFLAASMGLLASTVTAALLSLV
jgi:energy-coupling factor transporter transmembrane protein EcfT